MRKVLGLQSAGLAENPWGKPPRPKGAKALGLRFERAVGKVLPQALHGQWLRFVDNNGPGYCCPDFLVAQGATLWVLECKLTDWDEAEAQLEGLYRPVLGLLWSGPIRCITVARNLSPHTRRDAVVGTWEAALQMPRAVLHVFGKPQGPSQALGLGTPDLRPWGSIFPTEGQSVVVGRASPLRQEGAFT